MNIFTFLCVALVSAQGAVATPSTTKDIVKANQSVIAKPSKAPLSKSQVADLKADPYSLLNTFPKGGPQMARYVARAVATEASLVVGILRASQRASFDQASAIGAGLARAVRGPLAEFIKDVSKKVAQLGSISTQISYNAIGPINNSYSRVIPKPVRIGLADASGGKFNFAPHQGGGVAGSKGDPIQIGPDYAAFLPNAEDNQIFQKILTTPWETVALIAENAEDNGATSTSPTQ